MREEEFTLTSTKVLSFLLPTIVSSGLRRSCRSGDGIGVDFTVTFLTFPAFLGKSRIKFGL
jgi:hypothetical protein